MNGELVVKSKLPKDFSGEQSLFESRKQTE
jgi:hypothetical protein